MAESQIIVALIAFEPWRKEIKSRMISSLESCVELHDQLLNNFLSLFAPPLSDGAYLDTGRPS